MTMTTTATTDPVAGTSVPEKLLVGVSGSVAALNLPSYLYAFRAAGVAQIAAVLTTTAASFLPAGTLRLLCDGVYTEQDHGRGHVALGRWPSQVLVLPATAHLLGCVACGLAPNLLATTLLATEVPITFVPAMNPAMWRKAAVRRNVATLRADGHRVLDPVPGAAFEVASRAIVPSLMVPPPEVVLHYLSGEPVGETEAS
jgi:phosphopantothenoylcysteine decarboxylase